MKRLGTSHAAVSASVGAAAAGLASVPGRAGRRRGVGDKMMGLSAAALAVALLSASAASAAVISFDFRSAPSNVFSSGGVTVTATAHTMANDQSFGPQVTLGLSPSGLGAQSEPPDSPLVDGQDTNEIVRFAFSEVVRIVSLTLSEADDEDTFSFGYQDDLGYQHLTSAQTLNSGSTTWNFAADPDEATYTFNNSYLSSIFGIGAISDNSEFTIAGMTVETSDPSAVPLPSAGWCLIAGLGSLAALKRRRKAA